MKKQIESIEKFGFVKIKNKEEYLQTIPILVEEGYSLVGETFPITPTPFDKGFGGRKKDRKNSIYLMVYWGDGNEYDKWLWMADVLRKDVVSERFPIGTPDSL